jgi:hypothetical protein
MVTICVQQKIQEISEELAFLILNSRKKINERSCLHSPSLVHAIKRYLFYMRAKRCKSGFYL